MLLVFLLVACSLVAIVAFSLLAQGTTSGQGLSESIQAYAIAIGGKEWYLQQLADVVNDWTNEVGKNYMKYLGSGEDNFDISVIEASANSVSFIITGKVPGYLNQTVRRQISLTAKKLPKACRFAIFWQEDGPGDRLNLFKKGGGTKIYGNFWSRGSTQIDKPSEVTDGQIYYGSGETVAGTGTFTSQELQPRFPNMPVIDATSYEDLMNQYDSLIDANTSTDTLPPPEPGFNLAGERLYWNFQTEGNLTITGYGRIIAKNDVLLHNTGGGKRKQTLIITPDPGKTIEIMAGKNFIISNTRGKREIIINPGTILYARNNIDSDSLFQIMQSNPTNITEALVLARRRLMVTDGASITNSTLYVDYHNTLSTNNLLQISGSGTTVKGAVISRGRAEPSLQINDAASVSGFIYQYGSSMANPTLGEGQAQIDGGSTIIGSLLARQFNSDSLGPATITYDLSEVLSALPQGFSGYVMTEPNSWDDN